MKESSRNGCQAARKGWTDQPRQVEKIQPVSEASKLGREERDNIPIPSACCILAVLANPVVSGGRTTRERFPWLELREANATSC